MSNPGKIPYNPTKLGTQRDPNARTTASEAGNFVGIRMVFKWAYLTFLLPLTV
jgi:hypothetical protein